jgi:uncharacterized protein DUF6457
VATDAAQWLEHFAAALGVETPSEQEVATLLALAGVAAHASERTAAPVSCWLVARSGLTPDDGLAKATEVATSLAD